MHSLYSNEPFWSASDGSIKSGTFQSTQDGNSVAGFLFFFSLIKSQNGECNVKYCKRFLFGICPEVLVFKDRVFLLWLQILNWCKISSRHIYSPFWLLLPYQFCKKKKKKKKKYQFIVDSFSLVWVMMKTFNLHHKGWFNE